MPTYIKELGIERIGFIIRERKASQSLIWILGSSYGKSI